MLGFRGAGFTNDPLEQGGPPFAMEIYTV